MRSLDQLLRKHILAVKPYSSARSEYPTSDNTAPNTASAHTFLDANENAFGSPASLHVNRYPDPLQIQLKKRIAEIKGIPEDRINTIFLGNGSDEPIDLIIRAFCEPMTDGVTETGDEIIITPPTYGMYEVSAAIHNVRLRRIPLVKTAGSNDASSNGAVFRLDADAVLNAVTPRTKVIFLCSPNNPTANLLETSDVERVLRGFDGIVVLDEAYIDFAAEHSFLPRLYTTPEVFPNLIILQTFSKAWGMAGLRLGMAFARAEIIAVLNKIKPPYNINALAQEAALNALQDAAWQKNVVVETLRERAFVQAELAKYPFVRRIFPSDANFLLVEMDNAQDWYKRLLKANVIVRDRSSVALCEDCLRITIGTKEENMRLLGALNE